MTRFFRDIPGLEPAGDGETETFRHLPAHRLDLVEVYASEHRDIRMIPNEVDFVVAFVVGDRGGAMPEMQVAGLELVNEPVWAAEAFDDPSFANVARSRVRAPDGRIGVIEQVRD